MPGSEPQTGDVYYYPYVWKRQGKHGEPETDRPCCVAIRFKSGGFRGANTFLLASTQSGPPHDGFGVEVPSEIVRNLRKLDLSKVTHLVLSEYNGDTADHPSFADHEYLGSIPLEFLKPHLTGWVERLRTGAGEVNRTGTS